jgi:hypothetical protein
MTKSILSNECDQSTLQQQQQNSYTQADVALQFW